MTCIENLILKLNGVFKSLFNKLCEMLLCTSKLSALISQTAETIVGYAA